MADSHFLVPLASLGCCCCRGVQKRFRSVFRLGSVKRITTTSGLLIGLCMFFFANYSINDVVEMMKEDTTPLAAKLSGAADGPNATWIRLRQELRKRNDRAPAKVVMFGYMRGGSTLFSEVFNLDPLSDVMWHEPLDAFYESHLALEPFSIPQSLLYFDNFTRRSLSEYEQTEITRYLENLLECRPENLPLQTFGHFYMYYSSAFKAVHACMETKKSKALINECTKPLRPITGFLDLIRRNMSTSMGNRIEQIVAALKSHLRQNRRLDALIRGADGTEFGDGKIPQHLKKFLRQKETIVEDVLGVVRGASADNVRLLLEYFLCLAQTEVAVKDCIRPAYESCRGATLVSAKVIRLMLDSLEDLIGRNPDVHVVYYVRDPRAMAKSRSNRTLFLTMDSADRSAVQESKILCAGMREDLRAKRRLERKYPGSIVTIRYEDFVRRPRLIATDLFERLGRRVRSDLLDNWIRSRFNGSQDNGVYGTVRVDPVSTSVSWMKETNVREALEMERHCRDVLQELGYVSLMSNLPEDIYAAETETETLRSDGTPL